MGFLIVDESDIGGRKRNEDFYSVSVKETSLGEALFCVVCDGVGGSHGDQASKLVSAEMEKWFSLFSQSDIILEDITAQVNDLIDDINYELIQRGLLMQAKFGTTLTAILLISGRYFTFHVGDTRIYQFSEELNCLTSDHTMLAVKIRNGQITAEEAKLRNEKHILLQCVGVNETLEIENNQGMYREGDVFLLCSDGLYATLNDGEVWDIMEMMQEADLEESQAVAKELIDSVKFRGETDNITSVYIKTV